MSLPTRFSEAAEKVSSGLIKNVSQNDQLSLYGLYSVVRKGPAPNEAPSVLLDPKGFSKWTAWTGESHLSKEEAMEKYIELVAVLETKPTSAKQENTTDGFGNKASTGFDVSGEEMCGDAELDICYWATMGDTKSVRYCLEVQKVSVNFRDQDGLTALMRAVDRNEEHVVDILMAAGADIDAVDGEGQTALHYAAYCEHADMAGLLISYGACTDIKDGDDMTAFEAAAGETARVMREAKAGKWTRTSAMYPVARKQVGIAGFGRIGGRTQLMMVASAAVVLGLIVHYRYRR